MLSWAGLFDSLPRALATWAACTDLALGGLLSIAFVWDDDCCGGLLLGLVDQLGQFVDDPLLHLFGVARRAFCGNQRSRPTASRWLMRTSGSSSSPACRCLRGQSVHRLHVVAVDTPIGRLAGLPVLQVAGAFEQFVVEILQQCVVERPRADLSLAFAGAGLAALGLVSSAAASPLSDASR